MGEKTFDLNDISPLDFFGVNDKNIILIQRVFPKLKIIARGNQLKVLGDEALIHEFEEKFHAFVSHIEHFNRLNEEDILEIIDNNGAPHAHKSDDAKGILLHGRDGKVIKALTINQKKLVKACEENDMIFAIGPAGSGKTYTAVAMAVRALKNREVKRIILTRPAVEAGENLGFLPGDLRDKLDPYLQPLYDALRDMIPAQKLLSYLDDFTIEIAPLAFMRGRTLDNAFVILDEAQNATENQMKMFLTRMGKSAKFVVTGDITQVDLPKNQQSGLVQAMNILKKVKGIEFILLDHGDVVRHKLVADIIKAYDKKERTKLEIGDKGNNA